MGEWVRECDIVDFWGGHGWDDVALTSVRAGNCRDEAAARELAALMSEISEDQYCAGWESGLEYSLFSAAFEGTCYGDGISLRQRQGLMELAHRCDGWWVFVKGWGQRFMPMEEWTEMYKER
jgi:hypothetical protein